MLLTKIRQPELLKNPGVLCTQSTELDGLFVVSNGAGIAISYEMTFKQKPMRKTVMC